MSPGEVRLLAAHVSRALARYVPEAQREAAANGGEVPQALLAVAELLAFCATARHSAPHVADVGGPGEGGGMDGVLVLTRREAAARLRCSLRTVDRLIASGELPTVRLGNGPARVRAADLAAYVEGLGGGSFRARASKKGA